MTNISGTIVPIAHCIVPTTNQTTPSEPASFSVTPLLGTLQFDIGEATVRPKGMRYQIIRSPGTLAITGSYSVLWEGDASRVVLPADVRSIFWYHSRTATESHTSPLQPNTFGTGTKPWINPESVPGNRAYPDGEFMYSVDSYWTLGRGTGLTNQANPALVTSGGVSGSRGKYVWKVNSGVTGGTGQQLSTYRWDVDSSTNNWGPRMMPGQSGIAYFVMRNVGTPYFTVIPGAAAFLPNSAGAQPAETSITLNLAATIGAGNSGEWVTTVYTFVMPSSHYDHARIYLRGPTSHVGTQACMEIGAMQLSIL